LHFSYRHDKPTSPNPNLKETIRVIDRAYSVLDNKVRVTQIQREKWPIEWITVPRFETNFFTSARLEGAFSVNEIINYQWLPPQAVPTCE